MNGWWKLTDKSSTQWVRPFEFPNEQSRQISWHFRYPDKMTNALTNGVDSKTDCLNIQAKSLSNHPEFIDILVVLSQHSMGELDSLPSKLIVYTLWQLGNIFILVKSHFIGILLEFTCKVRVATMTHDHDDTPHTIFNAISDTCWKVSEFIDFDLKNRNSDLPACFSALIWDFSQSIKIPLSKTMKTGFWEYLKIYYLWTRKSKVSDYI